MSRYFTRKDSEFIKKNGEILHEKVRIIKSDGTNMIVDDDGVQYTIPQEFVDNTLKLFNKPYQTGPGINNRLMRDFNLTCDDITTPFSVFSRSPMDFNSHDFFGVLFDDESDDDESDEHQVTRLPRTKEKSKRRIKSGARLRLKNNRTKKNKKID